MGAKDCRQECLLREAEGVMLHSKEGDGTAVEHLAGDLLVGDRVRSAQNFDQTEMYPLVVCGVQEFWI